MTELKSNLTRRAFVGGAVAFGFASLALSYPAFADDDDDEELTSSEVQAQADEARAKLDDMHERLNQASDDYYAALQDYDAATAKMEEAQARIDENSAKISELQESLGNRARGMYRDGQITFLDVLVGSSSFEDFLKNWSTLQTINEADADLVAQTKALREENEAQRAEYESQAEIAQQKMDEAEAIKSEAEQLVEEYEAEVESLDAKVAELVEQERQAAAEAEAARLQAEFEAQQAAAEEEESSDSGSDSGDDSSDSGGDSGSDSSDSSDSSSDSSGSSSTSSSSGGGGTPNTAALSVAQSMLGVPYVWGGSTPSGFDCSGLTMYCYNATGYSLPHNTEAQYASANYVLSLSQAEPGDVLYKSGHVGICATSGGGKYIHAPSPGKVVCYSTYSLFYCALRW